MVNGQTEISGVFGDDLDSRIEEAEAIRTTARNLQQQYRDVCGTITPPEPVDCARGNAVAVLEAPHTDDVEKRLNEARLYLEEAVDYVPGASVPDVV